MAKPEDGKMTTNANINNINANNNKYKYQDVEYKKADAIDFIYQYYRNKTPKDKLKYTKS